VNRKKLGKEGVYFTKEMSDDVSICGITGFRTENDSAFLVRYAHLPRNFLDHLISEQPQIFNKKLDRGHDL